MNNKWELLKLLNEGMCDYFAPLVDDCGTHLVDHLLANGVTVQKWIPVTERLPKEWVEVLVWSRCGFHETAVYIGIPGKWRITWNHALLEEGTVTHWMPLPKLPEDGGAENA